MTSLAVVTVPDGRIVIAAGGGHAIFRWDARTGEPVGPPIDVST